MAGVGEETLVQLDRLHELLPVSKLLGLKQEEERNAKVVLPHGFEHIKSQAAKRITLPAFVAVCGQRKVHLEFSPAPENDNYWMSFYVKGQFTLPLTVTYLETTWYSKGTLVPVFEIRTHDELFDGLYASASSDPPIAKTFLAEKVNRNLILDIGQFDRFTVDARFIRITQLLDKAELAKAELLKKRLEKLVEVAAVIENWHMPVEAEAEAEAKED